MDPNETLRQLRELCSDPIEGDLSEIIELFDALDGWLSRGGFLPEAWAR